MLKSALKIVFVTLATMLCFSKTAIAQPHPSHAEFDAVVDQYVDKRDFNGTILIARRGEIVYETFRGVADVEWNVPHTAESKYRIGSLSKPFLATLVMRLVERGEISLQGTLGEYLPDLYGDTPASEVTVEQLLSHTSGLQDIPNNFSDPWFNTTARMSFEPRQFAREWIKPVLVSEPGEKWRYNNAGFILLGVIVEETTGQSYEANLQTHIFEPAGMEDSGVFSENEVITRLARGYAKAPTGERTQPIHVDSSVFFSAAGIYSTALDVFRFDQALYSNEIISPASRSLMHTKKTDFPYGYGWGVEQWPLGDSEVLDVVHHTGSIPGYQSFYIRSEANQDFVVVLNNTNNGSAVIEMGRNLMIMLNSGVVPEVYRNLDDYLSPIASREGTEAMIEALEGLGGELSEFDTRERTLNRLGYKYLRTASEAEGGGETRGGAVAIFRLATQLYPNSANTHDSLGEAYRAAGNFEAAIESYSRALELNPESQSAQAALQELRDTQ